MARAQQAKWFADALLSNANGYRSFEAQTFGVGPAMQAGQILLVDGGLPPAAGTNAARVLLEAIPVRTAGQSVAALVLARDAEVNDAYLVYGPITGGGIGTANGQLASISNIIVRFGVHGQSIVSPSETEADAEVEAEGEPPPEPVAA